MTDTTPTNGPLHGLRILDLSRILAGPTCTQLLGDYGADVIKVEKPGVGDDTRTWGPPYVTGIDGEPSTESAYYLSANRNKRSIAIDIATEEGARKIRKLAGKCDVLIENFKTAGLKKYGLDHETMLAEYPHLIYCSITGFGQSGPNAHKPGYDLLAQAYGGIMSLTGPKESEPVKAGVAVADVVCGLYACTAILAAINVRHQTGKGQHIDIGLVDTQVAWLINAGTNYLCTGDVPPRHGNEHPSIVPYQVFEASDGHIVVAAGNDSQYQRFCQALDRNDLAEHPDYLTNAQRVQQRETLIPILSDIVKTKNKDELVARMEQHGVPGGPINTLKEVFDSDQVAARDMKISMQHDTAQSGHVDLIGNPVKFSTTPVSYRRAPPTCGQHTDEVLKELLDG